jgi:hypothetical protein
MRPESRVRDFVDATVSNRLVEEALDLHAQFRLAT